MISQPACIAPGNVGWNVFDGKKGSLFGCFRKELPECYTVLVKMVVADRKANAKMKGCAKQGGIQKRFPLSPEFKMNVTSRLVYGRIQLTCHMFFS